ncbi:hypothetical protein HY213_04185 [Candidatus Peregrinibacteria bacterium]|nr:hypothetical protein [Candidatus Peregrinibacteria bacterium]
MFKTCKHCQQTFEITDDDLAFYDRVSPVFQEKKYAIPPPTLCPDCRQQRRLAWRNERNLYSRNCDLCKRHIISVYPADVIFPVYCPKCWWSDRWNALSYGMAYNEAEDFFVQWRRLHDRVPQLAMQNDDGIGSENSEYCYDISRAKNCYRTIGSWYIQDCHYSLNVNHAKDVVDCNTVSIGCELVYESLDSQRLYHCTYLQNAENCSDCFFGYDLKGCKHCFGCVGLRQKEFCIFNQQHSESEYRAKMRELNLGSHKTMQQCQSQFDTWSLQFPRKFANLQNCEECEGNNLFNCKNVLGYSVFNSEHSKFLDRCDGPKFCYDLINTGNPQWCYDCVTSDDSFMTLFSVWCWKSRNILLSDNCHSSEHLLGCIGVHRGRHCILNRQYAREEYEKLAGTIIDSLKRSTKWGEHLAISLSPFEYNESAAMEYYPLHCETVLSSGWKWNDRLPYTTGKENISWESIPDAIVDTPQNISEQILACERCSKNYKVLPQEVSFYKDMPAPLPRKCPNCRHLDRFRRKNPTKLWSRTCTKCGKEIQTTFAPGRPEIVYCEQCYLKNVY